MGHYGHPWLLSAFAGGGGGGGTAAAGAEAAAKLSRTEEPTISGTHVSAVVVPAVSTEQGNHCNQLAGDAAADELDAENGHGGNGVMSYASALTRLVLQATER
jgi:hypothetical protein